MRVVVTGASGNVGTSLLRALAEDDAVEEVLGLARRRPRGEFPKVEWQAANIETDDLVPHFHDADCVVHLAWGIQPSHDVPALRRTNVTGSERVFGAVAEAGVPALVYASSVGAYSPGPKERPVDESWPTDGTPTSFYARHKAEVERLLDHFQVERPETRVVRLRPGLIFKRSSAEEQRRYFLGPLFPRLLARYGARAVVPDIDGLRVQAVHTRDIAQAYRLAIAGDVHGAFNVAAEPVLDARTLGRALGARVVPVPPAVARSAMTATWRLRLQPTPPGWLDMGLAVPIMDTTRARKELGWEPRHSSLDAIRDVLSGMAEGDGEPTPPLESARR
ncbi:MAG TPA: NAD-dependent epimerase/dehydratase family protein [Gaiellaceae bacterium]|nr:NAD-dependent epimerase/dehydratase family protein [Gaiellaceae bacterium]